MRCDLVTSFLARLVAESTGRLSTSAFIFTQTRLFTSRISTCVADHVERAQIRAETEDLAETNGRILVRKSFARWWEKNRFSPLIDGRSVVSFSPLLQIVERFTVSSTLFTSTRMIERRSSNKLNDDRKDRRIRVYLRESSQVLLPFLLLLQLVLSCNGNRQIRAVVLAEHRNEIWEKFSNH